MPSPTVREERERYKDAYVIPDAGLGGAIAVPPTAHAESVELAEELWTTTEAIVQNMGL